MLVLGHLNMFMLILQSNSLRSVMSIRGVAILHWAWTQILVQLVSQSFQMSLDVLQAASQSLPVASLKPIWEQGVWASIFGDSSGDVVGDFIERSFVRPVSSVDVRSIDIESGVVKGKARRVAEDYFDVVKFKPSVSWQEQQEAGRL